MEFEMFGQAEQAQKKLKDLEDMVHLEVYKRTGRSGSLFDRTFGMCDFMTAWVLRHFEDRGCHAINFVGIKIPQKEIKGQKTYASHTIGVLYDFQKDDCESIVCAQYDITQKSLIEVIKRENFYHRLRTVYGGGVWSPGGSWLSQLDIGEFGDYVGNLDK